MAKKNQPKKRVVDLVSDKFSELSKDEWSEYELVEVAYVKEGPSRYLRLFIDKEGGISHEDCQLVSKEISNYLDEVDPIKEEYILEVSSPGIERPLNKIEDYDRFAGRLAEVKLYAPINGLKLYVGEIKGVEDGNISLELEDDGADLKIPFDKISSAKLKFRFE